MTLGGIWTAIVADGDGVTVVKVGGSTLRVLEMGDTPKPPLKGRAEGLRG
jgi:hypothetical protein